MNTFAFCLTLAYGFPALLGNTYRERVFDISDISVSDLTSSQNTLYVLYVFLEFLADSQSKCTFEQKLALSGQTGVDYFQCKTYSI